MTKEVRLRSLSRLQARRRFEEIKASGFRPQVGLTEDLLSLRKKVTAVSDSLEGKAGFEHDRKVGMALYCALPPSKLSLRRAADDGIWRFLSLDVLPDVVRRRNPDAGEEWFWSSKWRIWLRRIWWLMHLSWQGDVDRTLLALQGWTTDTVAQFIERPGRGFRVDLWRRIAMESATQKVGEAHFRRVMKLNTALLASIEPTISPEVLNSYVERLFFATASR